jgi:Right handed beta helix region/Protein of unknown function (DUF1565)
MVLTKLFQTDLVHFLGVVFLAIAILVFSQGSVGSAFAKEYFLTPQGNDAHPGDKSHPWQTLQHAVTMAQPGDTIFLRAGSYREEVHLNRSGNAKSPITIASAPGEAVTVLSLVVERGVSHLRLKDFAVMGYKNWGIELSGDNHHIHLSGLRIQGGEAGLRLTVGDSGNAPQFGPVSHITIENCQIKDTLYTGVDGTPGPCDHLTIRRVEVSGAGVKGTEFYGADGIGIEKGQHITVEECFIHDNGGDGIDLNSRDRGGRVPGIVVRGNRVARNRLNGVKLWAGGRLERNAIWGQGENPLMVGIFHCQAEIIHNTVAYNMWAKDYGGRNYGATFGYPEPEGVGPARPQVVLTMHHNIFAFNTGPAHGEPTGIYLGPGVHLKEEHDNLFFSRADAEIFLAQQGREEGREISREDIAKGLWARLTGQGKGDLAANPRFVSGWPKVDLHLQSGSPATGRGAY